jgi:electron transfer flavoprotein alpha subunit
METILCLLHTDGDAAGGAPLSKAARETLSAAAALSGELPGSRVDVGLVGASVEAAADSIAGAFAAASFYGVSGEEFAASRYATDAASAAALAAESGAGLILAPASARWSRSLPGVAHRLGGGIDTQVTGLEAGSGGLEIQRWYYRQRMVATLTRAQRPWILLIAAGVFSPLADAPGSANLKPVDVGLPDRAPRTRVIGEETASADAQTINPDADLLFVAGAGWTKKQVDGEVHLAEAETSILTFLEKGRASLGSSKSLVDQSSEGEAVLPFLSHLNQVGQTGATPRHPKGLATCCHGEEPHVVGWRFIRERRAVNTDAGCGWSQGKADVVYVADAFQVMARLNELLG